MPLLSQRPVTGRFTVTHDNPGPVEITGAKIVVRAADNTSYDLTETSAATPLPITVPPSGTGTALVLGRAAGFPERGNYRAWVELSIPGLALLSSEDKAATVAVSDLFSELRDPGDGTIRESFFTVAPDNTIAATGAPPTIIAVGEYTLTVALHTLIRLSTDIRLSQALAASFNSQAAGRWAYEQNVITVTQRAGGWTVSPMLRVEGVHDTGIAERFFMAGPMDGIAGPVAARPGGRPQSGGTTRPAAADILFGAVHGPFSLPGRWMVQASLFNQLPNWDAPVDLMTTNPFEVMVSDIRIDMVYPGDGTAVKIGMRIDPLTAVETEMVRWVEGTPGAGIQISFGGLV